MPQLPPKAPDQQGKKAAPMDNDKGAAIHRASPVIDTNPSASTAPVCASREPRESKDRAPVKDLVEKNKGIGKEIEEKGRQLPGEVSRVFSSNFLLLLLLLLPILPIYLYNVSSIFFSRPTSYAERAGARGVRGPARRTWYLTSSFSYSEFFVCSH